MRKHITIENITLTSLIITIILLMLGVFIFYKNILHLKQIQERREITAYKNTPSVTEKTKSDISNFLFPDSREVFRPEVLKSDPIAGMQLSMAEYLMAIYILNLYGEENTINNGGAAKKIYKSRLREEYHLAKIKYNNFLLVIIFSTIMWLQMILYHIKDKLCKSEREMISLINLKTEIMLNEFIPLKNMRKSSYNFLYSYNSNSLKSLLIFKFQKIEITKTSGIKLKTGERISMRKIEGIKETK